MTKATLAGGALATTLVLVALVAGYRALGRGDAPAAPAAASSPATSAPAPAAPPDAATTPGATADAGTEPAAAQGFLYGRVTTDGGETYEGRLRWGGTQEAFWSDTFNGVKGENPWAALVPPERLPRVSRPLEIFGLAIGDRESPVDLDRWFMARLGDLARIEARGRDVLVTLKSGTVFDLDRFEASDFDDGVRVWDAEQGVVDLKAGRIRSIELLPTPTLADQPGRLHGTVRTPRSEFTGFLQWDRNEGVGSDELEGRSADGELALRFDGLRSIERSRDGCRVTRLDGREVELSGTSETGVGNLGVYVDDPRYGRVLVSWDAFVRVDFDPPGAHGSGPAYDDFPPGGPLTGSVTTGAGDRLAGRLVFDLDESETTETFDAPSGGVDYTLPFGGIASIVPPGRAGEGAPFGLVTLRSGEELRLEPSGDLGEWNAGLLVFVEGAERPEYVLWSEVARIDFDPPAIAP